MTTFDFDAQNPPPQSTNPKDALGKLKPSPHFIPPSAILEEAVVMSLGAQKYGLFNWRKNTVAYTVYLSAAFRHLLQCLDGEDRDPESQALHLAHARACCGILIDAISLGTVLDDRPAPGNASEVIKNLTKHLSTEKKPL